MVQLLPEDLLEGMREDSLKEDNQGVDGHVECAVVGAVAVGYVAIVVE